MDNASLIGKERSGTGRRSARGTVGHVGNLRVRNTSLQGKVSSGNRLPPVARVSTYGGHGERSGFGDGFRSEVEDAEAERVKEKIYGYREDVLEEFRREKRMEEPRKEKQWVQVGSRLLVRVFSRQSSGRPH